MSFCTNNALGSCSFLILYKEISIMNRIKNWKKQFAVIYTGQAFSILGSAAVQFAVIWWLTIQTESAITLTIASLVAFLPNMLIGPFAGVWIDRYNRRTVMILADGLVAVSSIILGAAFLLVETPHRRKHTGSSTLYKTRLHRKGLVWNYKKQS